MFLSKAFTPNNQFWKYIVGLAVLFIASGIGQLPLLLAVYLKTQATTGGVIPQNQADFMTILDKNLTLFLLLLSFFVAFLALLLVLKMHRQKLQDIITARLKIDWKRIFFSFTVSATFQIISIVVSYLLYPQNYQYNFQLMPFAILFCITLTMMPIQTSLEELVFRGYLMQGLSLVTQYKWIPLVITSVFFGLLHISNPEVDKIGNIALVYYIGTGFFLGIIALLDDGIELCLGFHAANNSIAALLVTSSWSVFQTPSVLIDISEPDAGMEILYPILILYPVLLYIFSKKYRWNNYKDKLTGIIQKH